MQISPVESIFRPNPPGRDLGLLVPFCRVLLHLIVKTGFMSLKYFLNLHHFSSISRRLSVNARHFLNKHWTFLEKSRTFLQKRGRFSEKRWTFSKKRRSFFSTPRRKEANGQETIDSHIYKASAINKQESSFLLAYKKLHLQFF